MKNKAIYLMLAVLGILLLASILNRFFEVIFDFDKYIYTKESLLFFSASKTIVALICIYLLSVFGLNKFSGLNKITFIRDKWALYFPILIIVFAIWTNFDLIRDTDFSNLLTQFWFHSSVAFSEELAMRGLILPLFIYYFRFKNHALYKSVIYSSLMFGLLHYSWLLSYPEQFWGITFQVMYAISIGTVLASLMLRTGNVYFVAIFHATLNFMFGGIEIGKFIGQSIPEESVSIGIDYINILSTLLIFTAIVGIGLIMIREVDREAVEEDLKEVNLDAPLFSLRTGK